MAVQYLHREIGPEFAKYVGTASRISLSSGLLLPRGVIKLLSKDSRTQ
jgi:hypothetical protein